MAQEKKLLLGFLGYIRNSHSLTPLVDILRDKVAVLLKVVGVVQTIKTEGNRLVGTVIRPPTRNGGCSRRRGLYVANHDAQVAILFNVIGGHQILGFDLKILIAVECPSSTRNP